MVHFFSSAQLDQAARDNRPDLGAFDRRVLFWHRPDGHMVVDSLDGVVAHCSLWWSEVPSLPGHRLGVIGHYAAADQACSQDLLSCALDTLRDQGCTIAVGPMDGNTWRRYRFVTERGQEPSFFLEPVNPDSWPSYWSASGFIPLATYTSALNSNLSHRAPHLERASRRLHDQGIRIRQMQPDQFESELRRIYAISVVSFANSYLYTPLPEPDFMAQSLAVRSQVRPELVYLAEQEQKPVGYVFAFPDWQEATRGGPVVSMVLKTMAILPGRCYAGLGRVLVAVVQDRARTLGFRRAIHALMHESNNSNNVSGHYDVQTIRRYTLFSKNLDS